MFVLEALVLTFMTTPLVTTLYPPNKRVRVAVSGANFNNVADDENRKAFRGSGDSDDGEFKRRFTFVLDKLEHLPGIMAFSQLIQPSLSNPTDSTVENASSSKISIKKQQGVPYIEALRLMELSDRVSAVMKSSASESLLRTDPLLSIFKMSGQLNDMNIETALSIVTYDDLANSVIERAQKNRSDMIMLPWIPPPSTDSVPLPHHVHEEPSTPKPVAHTNNPFDAFLKAAGATSSSESSPSALHSHFVRGVFSQATTDVALFVDQAGVSGKHGSSHHLFLPFFGGPDDRLGLDFVAQLCTNPRITATIIRVVKKELDIPVTPVAPAHLGDNIISEEAAHLTVASVSF